MTLSILSLASHLSYTRDALHMHESLYPRYRHETQAFTLEPKSIGSVARLTECPSVGRSVHQTRDFVTYSQNAFWGGATECLSAQRSVC
jgi:hypothetical protein